MATRKNIYEQVIEHLKDHIITNDLQPGDRLPTEHALAEQLGVNRLTVREALKVMAGMGIVQIRPRDGCRLKAFSFKPVLDHLRFRLMREDVAFTELVEARQLLEPLLLQLAVQRAGEDDFARMEASIEWMQALIDRGDPGARADVLFHQALAAAARNRALEGFSDLLQEFFQYLRSQTLNTSQEMRQASVDEHRQIHQALRERDLTRATRVLAAHLGRYDGFRLAPARPQHAPAAEPPECLPGA